LSVDNFAMISDGKVCDTSKVSKCCREKAFDLHSESFNYFLLNLHETLLLLKSGISLRSYVPKFIELNNLLPKSLDFTPVNYSVWGHCSRWHGYKISETDQLKRVLIECWVQLILNTLTLVIDQLPKKLTMVMDAKGAQLPMSNFI